MKLFSPTATMEVDPTGGTNTCQLNITFESLADFAPAAVARKVDSLRRLLELRTQLKEVRDRFAMDPDATSRINAIFNTIVKDPKLAEELRNKLAAPASK
jgi:type VI secretion system protein ImpB